MTKSEFLEVPLCDSIGAGGMMKGKSIVIVGTVGVRPITAVSRRWRRISSNIMTQLIDLFDIFRCFKMSLVNHLYFTDREYL